MNPENPENPENRDNPEMKILLVCLGNICRSPTAEAALREALAEAGLDGRVEVDSAGTGDWHVGNPPDERMTKAAAAVGLELSGRARQVTPGDLRAYDLVLGMDRHNVADLRAMAGDDELAQRVRLFRDFAPDAEAGEPLDVPDPYYGGPEGFEHVVEVVRAAARGVVDHVRDRLDSVRG
jgi:protein-tyrosine phosphatase